MDNTDDKLDRAADGSFVDRREETAEQSQRPTLVHQRQFSLVSSSYIDLDLLHSSFTSSGYSSSLHGGSALTSPAGSSLASPTDAPHVCPDLAGQTGLDAANDSVLKLQSALPFQCELSPVDSGHSVQPTPEDVVSLLQQCVPKYFLGGFNASASVQDCDAECLLGNNEIVVSTKDSLMTEGDLGCGVLTACEPRYLYETPTDTRHWQERECREYKFDKTVLRCREYKFDKTVLHSVNTPTNILKSSEKEEEREDVKYAVEVYIPASQPRNAECIPDEDSGVEDEEGENGTRKTSRGTCPGEGFYPCQDRHEPNAGGSTTDLFKASFLCAYCRTSCQRTITPTNWFLHSQFSVADTQHAESKKLQPKHKEARHDLDEHAKLVNIDEVSLISVMKFDTGQSILVPRHVSIPLFRTQYHKTADTAKYSGTKMPVLQKINPVKTVPLDNYSIHTGENQLHFAGAQNSKLKYATRFTSRTKSFENLKDIAIVTLFHSESGCEILSPSPTKLLLTSPFSSTLAESNVSGNMLEAPANSEDSVFTDEIRFEYDDDFAGEERQMIEYSPLADMSKERATRSRPSYTSSLSVIEEVTEDYDDDTNNMTVSTLSLTVRDYKQKHITDDRKEKPKKQMVTETTLFEVEPLLTNGGDVGRRETTDLQLQKGDSCICQTSDKRHNNTSTTRAVFENEQNEFVTQRVKKDADRFRNYKEFLFQYAEGRTFSESKEASTIKDNDSTIINLKLTAESFVTPITKTTVLRSNVLSGVPKSTQLPTDATAQDREPPTNGDSHGSSTPDNAVKRSISQTDDASFKRKNEMQLKKESNDITNYGDSQGGGVPATFDERTEDDDVFGEEESVHAEFDYGVLNPEPEKTLHALGSPADNPVNTVVTDCHPKTPDEEKEREEEENDESDEEEEEYSKYTWDEVVPSSEVSTPPAYRGVCTAMLQTHVLGEAAEEMIMMTVEDGEEERVGEAETNPDRRKLDSLMGTTSTAQSVSADTHFNVLDVATDNINETKTETSNFEREEEMEVKEQKEDEKDDEEEEQQEQHQKQKDETQEKKYQRKQEEQKKEKKRNDNEPKTTEENTIIDTSMLQRSFELTSTTLLTTKTSLLHVTLPDADLEKKTPTAVSNSTEGEIKTLHSTELACKTLNSEEKITDSNLYQGKTTVEDNRKSEIKTPYATTIKLDCQRENEAEIQKLSEIEIKTFTSSDNKDRASTSKGESDYVHRFREAEREMADKERAEQENENRQATENEVTSQDLNAWVKKNKITEIVDNQEALSVLDEASASHSPEMDSSGHAADDLRNTAPGGVTADDLRSTVPGCIKANDLRNTGPGGFAANDLRNTAPGGVAVDDLRNTVPDGVAVDDFRTVSDGVTAVDLRNTLPGGVAAGDLKNTVPGDVVADDLRNTVLSGVAADDLRNSIPVGVAADDLKNTVIDGVTTDDLRNTATGDTAIDDLKNTVAGAGVADNGMMNTVMHAGIAADDLRNTATGGVAVDDLRNTVPGGVAVDDLRNTVTDAGVAADALRTVRETGVPAPVTCELTIVTNATKQVWETAPFTMKWTRYPEDEPEQLQIEKDKGTYQNDVSSTNECGSNHIEMKSLKKSTASFENYPTENASDKTVLVARTKSLLESSNDIGADGSNDVTDGEVAMAINDMPFEARLENKAKAIEDDGSTSSSGITDRELANDKSDASTDDRDYYTESDRTSLDLVIVNDFSNNRDANLTDSGCAIFTDRGDANIFDRKYDRGGSKLRNSESLTDSRDTNLIDSRDTDVSDSKDTNLTDRRDTNLTDSKYTNLTDRRDTDLTESTDIRITECRDSKLTDRRDTNLSDIPDTNLTDSRGDTLFLNGGAKRTVSGDITLTDSGDVNLTDTRNSNLSNNDGANINVNLTDSGGANIIDSRCSSFIDRGDAKLTDISDSRLTGSRRGHQTDSVGATSADSWKDKALTVSTNDEKYLEGASPTGPVDVKPEEVVKTSVIHTPGESTDYSEERSGLLDVIEEVNEADDEAGRCTRNSCWQTTDGHTTGTLVPVLHHVDMKGSSNTYLNIQTRKQTENLLDETYSMDIHRTCNQTDHTCYMSESHVVKGVEYSEPATKSYSPLGAEAKRTYFMGGVDLKTIKVRGETNKCTAAAFCVDAEVEGKTTSERAEPTVPSDRLFDSEGRDCAVSGDIFKYGGGDESTRADDDQEIASGTLFAAADMELSKSKVAAFARTHFQPRNFGDPDDLKLEMRPTTESGENEFGTYEKAGGSISADILNQDLRDSRGADERAEGCKAVLAAANPAPAPASYDADVDDFETWAASRFQWLVQTLLMDRRSILTSGGQFLQHFAGWARDRLCRRRLLRFLCLYLLLLFFLLLWLLLFPVCEDDCSSANNLRNSMTFMLVHTNGPPPT